MKKEEEIHCFFDQDIEFIYPLNFSELRRRQSHFSLRQLTHRMFNNAGDYAVGARARQAVTVYTRAQKELISYALRSAISPLQNFFVS